MIQQILSHFIEATCSRSQMFIADRGDGWREIVSFSPCESREEFVFAHVQKKKEPGEGDSPGSISIGSLVLWGIGLHLRGWLCRIEFL